MTTLLYNGILTNEGRSFPGGLVITDQSITEVFEGPAPEGTFDQRTDLRGAYLLPGIIDAHVHFRQPGLTHKADIHSESQAAAAGGVTSYFDMPNVVPQTTTLQAWTDKMLIASRDSLVNYAFFYGATNDNADTFPQLDLQHIPGIKLFMGSSTGNMLVDRREALTRIFRESPLPLMAHCEDTALINQQIKLCQTQVGPDPDVIYHPLIRSAEACYRSTQLAVQLAQETGAQLHVAHLSTAQELQLFQPYTSSNHPRITAEACIAHLWFTDQDYPHLGTRIKCNPAIKTQADRDALRQALTDGRIATIGTDHAPHLLSEKQGGALKAVSGMPMIQFSLVTMLDLVDQGHLTLPRLVQLMCHQPADIFHVQGRGYLRPGYKADLVIVAPEAWTLQSDDILSKCQWSPLEGHTFSWRVKKTYVSGHIAYDGRRVHQSLPGQAIEFNA